MQFIHKQQFPRHLLQGGFFLFYLWIGWRFARWVGLVEAGQLPDFSRPAAIDGFLPISGLAGLRYWLESGSLFPVHPAAALIVLAVLLTALLCKRAFCSWLCPVFTLSEGLWRLGRRVLGRNFTPPLWLDLPLRSLKYLLLAFFLYQILFAMPFFGLETFLDSPYHQIVDVRMLDFFRHPSLFLLTFLGIFVVLSFFVQLPWCRYLCPYGALLGLVSLLSLGKICRDPQRCVRCNLCTSRCPAWLPVMVKGTIRSPECFACYRCVAGCPADALALRVMGRWAVRPALLAAVLLLLFIGIDLYGRSIERWQSATPPQEVGRILRAMKSS